MKYCGKNTTDPPCYDFYSNIKQILNIKGDLSFYWRIRDTNVESSSYILR